MIANPWADLPHNPDYVLPDDAPDVRQFNERASEIHRLQIDKLIPEPFIGNPEAPLVLLSNNPGFGKGAECRQVPAFKARMRDPGYHEIVNAIEAPQV